MVDKLKESLPSMFKASPPWFALLLVVGGFLAYLDRQESRVIDREKRMDAVSELRIANCHGVQAASTAAIKELNRVLLDQVKTLYKLQVTIEAEK